LTGQCDDVIHGLSSQIKLQSVDLMQIGTSDCGEKIQRVKTSKMVPAPPSFDPRSIAGGESERRSMQVTDAGTTTERFGGDEMHGKVQELTTEL
jgi:hypothetical protein